MNITKMILPLAATQLRQYKLTDKRQAALILRQLVDCYLSDDKNGFAEILRTFPLDRDAKIMIMDILWYEPNPE